MSPSSCNESGYSYEWCAVSKAARTEVSQATMKAPRFLVHSQQIPVVLIIYWQGGNFKNIEVIYNQYIQLTRHQHSSVCIAPPPQAWQEQNQDSVPHRWNSFSFLWNFQTCCDARTVPYSVGNGGALHSVGAVEAQSRTFITKSSEGKNKRKYIYL
jgi:hypothetical protein